MKFRVNVPYVGSLHLLVFIPALLMCVIMSCFVASTAIDNALHPPPPPVPPTPPAPPTPEELAELKLIKKKEERARRKAEGYIDDTVALLHAEDLINSAGYSCPSVQGLLPLGDKGRGNVLRAQCRNNVFFLLTLRPDGLATVEIMK